MSNKTTIALALAAGFIGGIASQHIAPVYAQTPTLTPKEIRSETFVIVDENGTPRGAFGIDGKGEPIMEVTDKKDHPYWPRWEGAWKGPLVPDFKAKPRLVPAQ
jgi:hypothetical protein